MILLTNSARLRQCLSEEVAKVLSEVQFEFFSATLKRLQNMGRLNPLGCQWRRKDQSQGDAVEEGTEGETHRGAG